MFYIKLFITLNGDRKYSTSFVVKYREITKPYTTPINSQYTLYYIVSDCSQTCTELISPSCQKGGNIDMFEPSKWDFESYAMYCKKKYRVKPTADLMEKVYGGKNLESVSNIIFR